MQMRALEWSGTAAGRSSVRRPLVMCELNCLQGRVQCVRRVFLGSVGGAAAATLSMVLDRVEKLYMRVHEWAE